MTKDSNRYPENTLAALVGRFNSSCGLGVTTEEFAYCWKVVFDAWEQKNQPLDRVQIEWLISNSSSTAERILKLFLELDYLRRGEDWRKTAYRIAQSPLDPLEAFLQLKSPQERRRQGVYFTPSLMADYVIRQVHQILVDHHSLPDGLGSRRITIIEPALGAGAFIEASIRFLYQRNQGGHAACWADVLSLALPRLAGTEIHPIALFLAHLNLAKLLKETGFRFDRAIALNLHLKDGLGFRSLENLITPGKSDLPVIVGNPPFGALVQRKPKPNSKLDYRSIDGKRIGERKTWLHDHYVQFFQHCHELVERNGRGLIGLVTNRGYLDNLTFRAMRHSLLNSFSRIEITDLGGQARGPSTTDENQFGITSGVCIGLFSKTRKAGESPNLRYRQVQGTIAEKNIAMGSAFGDSSRAVAVTAPHYLFVPRESEHQREFYQGLSICEAMPHRGSAVITARDWLVIDFDRNRLEQRLGQFADPEISDQHLRETMFSRTRSTRYPRGDSRSWKLAEARQTLRQDADWRQRIRCCQYRPLDYRFVFWADYMIDWPRHETTSLLSGSLQQNVALIARRQSPAKSACNFFWATTHAAVDGILRSDNRGNEYVFPLHLSDGCFNFSDKCFKLFQSRWKLDSDQQLAQPGHWLAYIYALLFCHEYRTRYASQLSTDFPHIMVTKHRCLAESMIKIGHRLIALHAGRTTSGYQICCKTADGIESNQQLAIDQPTWQDDRLWINSEYYVEKISKSMWQTQFGAHQVCRKWLKDRRGTSLSIDEFADYLSLLESVRQTGRCMQRLSRLIRQYGGWCQAFGTECLDDSKSAR